MKCVYPDQMQWINLNYGVFGISKGILYQDISTQLMKKVKDTEAIFPFSSANFIETTKASDRLYRQRLARTIAEYSQGWALASMADLIRNQLHIAIATLFQQPIPSASSALGKGVAFAFGETNNAPPLMKSTDPAILAYFLANPSNDDAITIGLENLQKRANSYAQATEREREALRGYKKVSPKNLRAAVLTIGLRPQITEILKLYNKTFSDFLSMGQDNLMRFWASVPSVDVEIELATGRNEFAQKKVDPNDMIDISFLNIAIPYCDIIVTERFWVDLVKRRKLDQKYNTIMLSDIRELEKHL